MRHTLNRAVYDPLLGELRTVDAPVFIGGRGGTAGAINISNEAYDSSWNGVTGVAPSKNAVYDKIETLAAGGGITRTIVVTSGNVSAGATASTDYVYLVAGAHTITLPTAVSNTNRYTIKNNHSAAITVDTT